jgi:hypothetical protein
LIGEFGERLCAAREEGDGEAFAAEATCQCRAEARPGTDDEDSAGVERGRAGVNRAAG